MSTSENDDYAWLPEPVDVTDNTRQLADVDHVIAQGPFSDNWESLKAYTVPRWYADAKFGIFLHWGVYSVPAFGGEWYSRNMYLEGSEPYKHHLETYGPHAQFGYKDFIPSFTMENYDPDDWASLFRQCGAQFVVPVAEHHDGFAMYDTDRSRWKATAMGPKRDVFGDLTAATKRAWMVAGASSHRAEHWFFMNGGSRFDSDVLDPRFMDFYGPAQREETSPHEQYLEDWLLRTAEIIDKYRPQVLWFDWWIEQPAFEPYCRKLAAYYYNRAAEWQREVAINYKWDAFAEGSAVYDIERGTMGGIREDVWQNDSSVSKTFWSWSAGHEYKEVHEIIAELADTVSKNGNLLLNIGPKPDGSIPEAERLLLRAVGAWLSINGEAIFASRPWLIPSEGPTQLKAGSFVDGAAPVHTAQDIRFTTRRDVTGEYLYAILLKRPDDGIARVRAFGTGSGLLSQGIQEVSVLGDPCRVEWTRRTESLDVSLHDTHPDSTGVVIKLFLEPETVPRREDFLHG